MITHKDPQDRERTAHAPYNFVRLPEKILQPPQDEHNELDQSAYNGHSGYFEITLETSSPLYIRGMMDPELFAWSKGNLTDQDKEELKQKMAKFFSVDGRLQIPGSSLRGMFRTLVEIISYSKLNPISDERYMYRSVDATRHGGTYRRRLFTEPTKNQFIPQYLAGYMHREGGDWFIRPAVEINDVTYGRVTHTKIREAIAGWSPGDQITYRSVYIKPGEVKLQKILEGNIQVQFMRVEAIADERNEEQGIDQPATLVETGPMTKKRSEAVVFPLNEKVKKDEWKKISPKLVSNYRENSIPRYKNKVLDGRDGVLQEGHPVFYLMEGEKLVSFGHCPMLRIPYINSPASLLPDDLRSTSWPDLAERIFGYVKKTDKNETQACAGRVIFEDAIWQDCDGEIFANGGNPVAPKILSAPKPTTFQHYLRQPEPDDKDKLLDYDDQTLPRGHKLYWARGDNPDYRENQEVVNKHPRQYTRIQPIQPKNRFKFILRFDNLTPVELGALSWVVQLGQSEAHRLRLGMAKPYGLGAVRFSEVTVKLCSRPGRYTQLFKKTKDPDILAWEDGLEEPATELEDAKKAFSSWVLADSEVNQENKAKLEDLARYKELLRMLAWPGPDPQKTEYMVDLKEFQERKVLPGPLAVPLPKAKKATVVARIHDIETQNVGCEIEGREDAYGVIDPRRFSRFAYKRGERYDCEILEEIPEPNGDVLLHLRPLSKL